MVNEKYFVQIFRASPLPGLILDAKCFTILEVNDAYLFSVNHTRDQLINKSIFDVTPYNREPRMPETIEVLNQSLDSVIKTSEPNKQVIPKFPFSTDYSAKSE